MRPTLSGPPRTIVIMGVVASGKSSIGAALATRINCAFQEGDDFHPPANIAKMREGIPLDDRDRLPWLDTISAWIVERAQAQEWGVVSCSALRRCYRNRLRQGVAYPLPFVFLDPDIDILRERLATRAGHFMPASLLGSQCEILERPAANESALVLSAPMCVGAACDAICTWLGDDGPVDPEHLPPPELGDLSREACTGRDESFPVPQSKGRYP